MDTRHDLERSGAKLMNYHGEAEIAARDLTHLELAQSKYLEGGDLSGDNGKLSTTDLKAIIN